MENKIQEIMNDKHKMSVLKVIGGATLIVALSALLGDFGLLIALALIYVMM